MPETKTRPSLVTNLDIIKTIAVIFMIIDHVGMYFFPETSWFRAVGRFGVPVWFFLVGYANTRELPNNLLIGAFILVAADVLLFNRLFVMNALVTIMILRLSIDYVMNFITQSRYIFVLSSVLMAIFYVGTNMVFEYGSLALAFAVLGFLTRHRDLVLEKTFVTNKDYIGFGFFTVLAFCLFQNAQFGFNEAQFVFLLLVTGVGVMTLMLMQSMTFPKIKGAGIVKFLQFCGRQTLYIYVAHLLVFKVVLFIFLLLN